VVGSKVLQNYDNLKKHHKRMTDAALYALQYPVGKFEKPEHITPPIITDWIATIALFPTELRHQTQHLSTTQLQTPYRPQGWTLHQLIHHCADSHLNSFVRFKLALTEPNPIIKPYDETLWATLPDVQMVDIDTSLRLLDALHARWVVLLRSLHATDFAKTFVHPATHHTTRIDENIGIYAWHCTHHLAHITQLKKVKNWV
jgi:hypothetical protein